MKVFGLISGLVLGLLSFIAGCGGSLVKALYGVELMYGPPPVPYNPNVTLEDFNYTPPSPAHPGDTLGLTAKTDPPATGASIGVEIGEPPLYQAFLNDSGFGADDIAGDDIWHGEIHIPLDAPPAQDLPTIARLSWWDGSDGNEMAGENLTILDDGE